MEDEILYKIYKIIQSSFLVKIDFFPQFYQNKQM